MAGIRAIKRRIKSANNISQITKAMQMVAASKMKKAQARAISGKPYAEKIKESVDRFAAGLKDQEHDVFKIYPAAEKKLVILISTNKGLVGGLNANLFRNLLQWYGDQAVSYITLGRKGRNFVRRAKQDIIADFSEEQFISTVSAITQLAVEEYNKGIYSEIAIVFNKFVSALKFEPSKIILLPFLPEHTDNEKKADTGNYIVEPEMSELLKALIPHYLETIVRRCILEAEASEYSAQMVAMKNATDSANDLKRELTLVFNKLRQQQITFEIADMVTARMAVE